MNGTIFIKMDQFPDFDRKIITKLRMKWAFFALLVAAFLLASYMLLKVIWGPAQALRWLGLALLAFHLCVGRFLAWAPL